MKKSLKTVLSGKLETAELNLLYKSYDIVGDIAVIRVPENLKQHSRLIAETVMQTHKRVKTVLRQVSPVSGDLRIRKLKWVAGERRTETVYREFGCFFRVDLAKCYFSPRLSHERMRIAQLVQPSEVVVNVFAGVGCYSILIAKHSRAEKIYSIDISSFAVQHMRENVELNKVWQQVIPIQGDAKEVIEEKLRSVADRVLMPLPERAYEYLEWAVLAVKPTGGWIHYCDFEHAGKKENPVEKVKVKVSERLQDLGLSFEVPFGRIVRTTGPNWYQVVLDIKMLPSAKIVINLL